MFVSQYARWSLRHPVVHKMLCGLLLFSYYLCIGLIIEFESFLLVLAALVLIALTIFLGASSNYKKQFSLDENNH